MVQGVVNDQLEPIVILPIVGPSGLTQVIEVIIDTGFSGFLFLPIELVSKLGLKYAYSSPLVLADGTRERSDVFNVTVMWDGRSRNVQAIASRGMSLVGMRMLEDHSLHVEVKDGGKVLIELLG